MDGVVPAAPGPVCPPASTVVADPRRPADVGGATVAGAGAVGRVGEPGPLQPVEAAMAAAITARRTMGHDRGRRERNPNNKEEDQGSSPHPPLIHEVSSRRRQFSCAASCPVSPRCDKDRSGPPPRHRRPRRAAVPSSGLLSSPLGRSAILDILGPSGIGPFWPHTSADLAPPGAAAKCDAHLAALAVLRRLQADDGRPASPDEQVTLARRGNWGAIPGAFDPADTR